MCRLVASAFKILPFLFCGPDTFFGGFKLRHGRSFLRQHVRFLRPKNAAQHRGMGLESEYKPMAPAMIRKMMKQVRIKQLLPRHPIGLFSRGDGPSIQVFISLQAEMFPLRFATSDKGPAIPARARA